MNKEKKLLRKEEVVRGLDQTDDWARSLQQLEARQQDLADCIPPFSPERLHALIEGDRLSQFELRRQADRYLLIFCLLFLALVASVLLRTAPAGITPLNVALLVLGGMDAWVVLRAARSLWLMRQTLRLRHCPYRMSRYADRLNRLTRCRRWWLNLVLCGSKAPASVENTRRFVFATQRVPSYAIATLLLLLVTFNADEAFATTRTYVKVTTTSGVSDTAICDTLYHILEQR